MPGEEAIKAWGAQNHRVFLPDQPLEIHFVNAPGRTGRRQADRRAGSSPGRILRGAHRRESPPSSSVANSTQADEQGRFALEDIPTTYRLQFEVRKKDPKPPWDDSWASAGLRFERPDRGDLRAWFGDREIRLQEFLLRVAGPGVHGRTSASVAGTAGTLDLTTGDPSDVRRGPITCSRRKRPY